MDERQLLEEYFKNLHPVIQRAITDTAVETHLRKLATTNHLHVDQWQVLENEVMMALVGMKRFDDFEKNIRSTLSLPTDVASALAADISASVFAPIREEIERSLSHPDAVAEKVNPIEDLSQEILQGYSSTSSTVQPKAITPEPQPEQKPTVKRTDAPASYSNGTPSTGRQDVHADPYRIPPDA